MPSGSADPDDIEVSIFREIRQSCVALSQITFAPPETFTSRELVDALKQLDSRLTQVIDSLADTKSYGISTSLADYIFVPIAYLLKRPVIEETELEYTLSIINTLIKRCWAFPGSLQMEMAQQLLPLITFLIGGKPNLDVNELPEHVDETISNGVDCLQNLLGGIKNQGSKYSDEFLNDPKNMLSVGHMVTVLLMFVQKGQSVRIQVQSLEVLSDLFKMFHDGETLSFMLPGVVSAITKVLKQKTRQKVIAKSLDLLSTAICFVFDDFDLGIETIDKGETLDDVKEHDMGVEHSVHLTISTSDDKKLHRTTSWLKATVYQLQKAFKIILKLDDRIDVKEPYFTLCSSMMSRCFLSCSILMPQILDCLAQVCNDEEYYTKFTEVLAFNSHVPEVLKLIEGELDKGIGIITMALRSPDSSKAIGLFNKFSFYFSVLLEFGWNYSVLGEKLIYTLRNELTLLNRKKKQPKPIEVSYGDELLSIILTSDFEVSEKVWSLNDILDVEVEKSLMKMLSYLGHRGASFLQYILFDLPPTDSVDLALAESMSLWLVMRSVQKTGLHHDDYLTDDYKDNSSTEVTYSLLEKAGELLSFAAIHEEPALTKATIIGLQCIEKACDILGNDFHSELVDYLYPVVDSLASPNDLIRLQAQKVILKIADQLYEGSVERLISENCDYLADKLSINMTGETITPRTPMIVGVLVKIGGIELVSQLDDIIATIFTLLDVYHQYATLCEGFFFVFDQIIDQVYNNVLSGVSLKDLEQNYEDVNVIYPAPWGLRNLEQVFDFVEKQVELLDDDHETVGEVIEEPIKKEKILEVDSDDESDAETNSVVSSPEDDTKWMSPITPKQYKILAEILQYSERLSKHRSIKVSAIALGLINKLIPILATEKTKFLPIAASIWPTAASFVTNDDLKLACSALSVVHTLISYANVFLTSRFCDLAKLLITKYHELIKKHETIYRRRRENATKCMVNKTSTTTNFESRIFEQLAVLCKTALLKLGRTLPLETALDIASVAYIYDDDETHYAFYDDVIYYFKKKA
ncbi:hypothetical protein KL918_003598 [Ogataea parapolymorpha]|uniref:TEL2-interacting protein 1 n=1 Tax=Ogataea parapolymorpha (strain ATCC 26012 / BCRC 20466 / JCM 22074 / NRRL Y-7560 / DL-1) TaxID=871575 RepID=W1Q7X0_OGAPD|nr:hypothetical protein HPODL_02676 [Ogataea parapolymorpha DL-1]ESW96036.1 hypothetical protein HPODL_02676 [Ogataea parapolymorpha DL-1]KAG7866701.1 hypothetical protein KL918_003598 [Ogataea parapolymorpha]KAG7870613.1 hypothetical protein KL916_004818 [Ogataea parapolymorpha]